jgi:drug/metabolite transporter (DMT)-like permease
MLLRPFFKAADRGNRGGSVTDKPPHGMSGTLHQLGPVLATALLFTCSDVLAKLSLEGGSDVVSLLVFRAGIGIAFMFLWLRLGPAATPLSPRMKWTALALGIVLTLNLVGVFKAIDLIPVSIAILTYFTYPLMTGLIGALTGLDRFTWAGAAAALVAFFGLALIIGANPGELALLGILAALGGALARTAMLLITRAALNTADPRLVTWYTMWASLPIFVVAALIAWDWHWPQTPLGWFATIGVGVATTSAFFTLYLSTQRIGPFRTALYMNLEPFMTAVLSAIILGDRLTPIQILGGVIMIAALCLFQMRRR